MRRRPGLHFRQCARILAGACEAMPLNFFTPSTAMPAHPRTSVSDSATCLPGRPVRTSSSRSMMSSSSASSWGQMQNGMGHWSTGLQQPSALLPTPHLGLPPDPCPNRVWCSSTTATGARRRLLRGEKQCRRAEAEGAARAGGNRRKLLQDSLPCRRADGQAEGSAAVEFGGRKSSVHALPLPQPARTQWRQTVKCR